jgi:AcrR family transcriptional regulator
LTTSPHASHHADPNAEGLRGRKKARRRQEILSIAGRLFNENGFDATTMAEIAEAADISPPTVFNYFGAKENILSALLFEGTARERLQHFSRPRRTGQPFATILGDLLCEMTANTLNIAGKRVWRYAESANIRRVDSVFQKEFTQSDRKLQRLIRAFLADYALVQRNGAKPDHDLLARLIFDRWTAHYFDFIKDDAMPLSRHQARLRADTAAMVDLLFDDGFAQSAPLATPEHAT